jgi:hypothetical protein
VGPRRPPWLIVDVGEQGEAIGLSLLPLVERSTPGTRSATRVPRWSSRRISQFPRGVIVDDGGGKRIRWWGLNLKCQARDLPVLKLTRLKTNG